MEDNFDLNKFTIDDDKSENQFINRLIEGHYCCDENIYSAILKLFQQMANRRKGRQNRKTFFGWLFKKSSFLDAYNKIKNKKADKGKAEYMLDYKYSKNSVMKKIKKKAARIKEKLRVESAIFNGKNKKYTEEVGDLTKGDY